MPEQNWSDNINKMAERPLPSPPPRDYGQRRRPMNWANALQPNLRPQPIQLEYVDRLQLLYHCQIMQQDRKIWLTLTYCKCNIMVYQS